LKSGYICVVARRTQGTINAGTVPEKVRVAREAVDIRSASVAKSLAGQADVAGRIAVVLTWTVSRTGVIEQIITCQAISAV
jgi:hypothetical protein